MPEVVVGVMWRLVYHEDSGILAPMLFPYEEAFRYGQFGYAAATGLVMAAVIAVLPTVFVRTPGIIHDEAGDLTDFAHGGCPADRCPLLPADLKRQVSRATWDTATIAGGFERVTLPMPAGRGAQGGGQLQGVSRRPCPSRRTPRGRRQPWRSSRS